MNDAMDNVHGISGTLFCYKAIRNNDNAVVSKKKERMFKEEEEEDIIKEVAEYPRRKELVMHSLQNLWRHCGEKGRNGF